MQIQPEDGKISGCFLAADPEGFRQKVTADLVERMLKGRERNLKARFQKRRRKG